MSQTPGPSTPAPLRPPIIQDAGEPEFTALQTTILGSIPRLILVLAGLLYPYAAKIGFPSSFVDSIAAGATPQIVAAATLGLSLLFSHLENVSGVPSIVAFYRLFAGKPKAASIAMLIGTAMALSCLPACTASTESQTLYATLGTVDVADVATDGLYTTHAISKSEAQKIAGLINVAHAAVQAWNTAYQANQTAGVTGQVDTSALQAAALAAITAMNTEIASAKSATQPATQP